MNKPKTIRWSKYSPDYKRSAVDRIVAGESPSAVANELGIRRKFLYAWRDAGWGTHGVAKPKKKPVGDPQQRQIARLKQQVASLQRLAGQQTAELDFFAKALRSIEEPRRKNGASSENGSTRRSKP